MGMQQVTIGRDFESWRRAARGLLVDCVPPADVVWAESGDPQPMLPALAVAAEDVEALPASAAVSVPAGFMEHARLVACHREPARWDLLYRILWRLTRGGERHLLDVAVDGDVHRLLSMEKAVRRDRHKLTAFVRFRRVTDPETGADHYVAWHRPDHYIVRLTAAFFVRRFGAMKWSILTPDDSVTWDGPDAAEPRFGPGVPATEAPQPDALEDLWRTYYASTFNPARTNLRAMKRELPVRHWATLPETQMLPDLLRDAPRRVEEMMATARRNTRAIKSTIKSASTPADPACTSTGSAADFLPERLELPLLRTASKACRGCDLYCKGTQTVFGEGPEDATVMFVGEQPGDQEDRAGRPFVGPAGQMLDAALQEAGVPRDECYVTNAVKHFKWEARGKRRIHSKPSAREVNACKPWLEAEIKVIDPKVIVCLGATAAQDLLGRDFRLTQHRGEPIKDTPWAPWVLATIHPSALLRMPDEAAREQARAQFVDDMRLVAKQIKSLKR